MYSGLFDRSGSELIVLYFYKFKNMLAQFCLNDQVIAALHTSTVARKSNCIILRYFQGKNNAEWYSYFFVRLYKRCVSMIWVRHSCNLLSLYYQGGTGTEYNSQSHNLMYSGLFDMSGSEFIVFKLNK